ncbi:MAG: ATP-binding cassette domain-containing protein [Oscillospiraceae bacterium]|nr:ATP-binding cassette domain-containing protein [Oscillospiraceae bacterium]
MEYSIHIKNVTKQFKDTTVLKNINVDFSKSHIHGLIGRNGSGKTMLMKCICGLVPVTSGEIVVNNKRIGKDVQIPENIGAIIETPGFMPNYSAVQNLMFLAQINNIIKKEDVCHAISSVGLDPKDKRHVGKYSLGMRQRLGLAQAIMEKPSILILDEPMNGLDKQGVADMREMLLDLKEQGKTILLASHSAEDIDVLCDTVSEMEHGELVRIK